MIRSKDKDLREYFEVENAHFLRTPPPLVRTHFACFSEQTYEKGGFSIFWEGWVSRRRRSIGSSSPFTEKKKGILQSFIENMKMNNIIHDSS